MHSWRNWGRTREWKRKTGQQRSLTAEVLPQLPIGPSNRPEISQNPRKNWPEKNNRPTQPPATTQPRPTTTRPQPVTTRRVPPTRRVVGKRPLGKRPVYRRPTGRPIAAGKATRRPTVRGRFRPVTRGTTKVICHSSANWVLVEKNI